MTLTSFGQTMTAGHLLPLDLHQVPIDVTSGWTASPGYQVPIYTVG